MNALGVIKINVKIARRVELLNYTDYDVIGKAREFYARVKAENPEFNLMWDEFYRTLRNTLILEADEEGIRRWEEMLGIIPSGSLEDRRLKVYIEWNSTVIWTDRTLRQFLDLFLGKGTYEMELIYDKYALKIKLRLGKTKVGYNALLNELKKIIPANIEMFMTIEISSDLYVGGLRRRHMHMTYKPYEPTEINSKLDAYVAGYLINTVIESWPIQAHGNLVSKGEEGYLASDIGYIRGEMIE